MTIYYLGSTSTFLHPWSVPSTSFDISYMRFVLHATNTMLQLFLQLVGNNFMKTKIYNLRNVEVYEKV